MVNVIQFVINIKNLHNFQIKYKDAFSEEEFLYHGIMIGKSIRKANSKHLTLNQFKNYLNSETKLLDDKFDDIIFDGFASNYNNNLIKTIVIPNTYEKMDFNVQSIGSVVN